RSATRQRSDDGRDAAADRRRPQAGGRGHRPRRPRHPPAVARRRLPRAHRRADEGGRVSVDLTLDRQVEPRRGAAVAVPRTGGGAKRNLLGIARTPLMLIVTAIQPALLLVLFRYVLGGAIQIPGSRPYVDFVVPAIFVEAVLIGGMTTSVGLAQDLKSGIIDR